MIHVPYQGLAPAMRDLLAGHIDVLIDNLGNVVPHLPDRSLKVLAATTETRLPEVPEVPAANELLPGFSHADWFGFVAPPQTPPEIAQKLSLAIAETLKQPDVAQRLRDFYVTPVGSSPAEMGAQLKQESERWRQVIGAAGLRPN
jgi:tripartite-type tricarboxylate transporter receptor subunit TctC